ncbi:MAG: nucleotide exchange factor GrpE [bacterium]|nr:nucleotide exchange factor GrpE [bacterium]
MPETPQPAVPVPPPTPPTEGQPTADELAKARQQAAEYLAGWQRAKADYVNLKRESDERSWQQAKSAVKSVVINLWADFFSNLELALRHIPPQQSKEPWVVGVQNGMKQFNVILKKLGFEDYTPTVGQPFSPFEHEAVEAVENSGKPAQTIVEVVRPGLRFVDDDDDVVVHARVKVAK